MVETSKLVKNTHRQIAWLILALLLLLRIPYTIAIIYFLPIENQTGSAIYEISTYFLTACLIWWERDRLADFHIDTLALCLIIFFRPLQTLILNIWKVESPLAFPHPLGLSLWAISLSLLIALAYSSFKPARITPRSLGWIALGLFTGVCISIVENLRTFSSIISSTLVSQTLLSPVLLSTSLNLIYHLGFAPINEEPLFRGFLWHATPTTQPSSSSNRFARTEVSIWTPAFRAARPRW